MAVPTAVSAATARPIATARPTMNSTLGPGTTTSSAEAAVKVNSLATVTSAS